MACRNTTGKADLDLCSKRCGEHPYTVACVVCGEPVEITNGYDEVIGHYHTGCFGYPCCGCYPSHWGDCFDPKPVGTRAKPPEDR